MRRTLLFLVMSFSLLSLFARPTVVVSLEEQGPSYALVSGVVERVASDTLLSRLGGEGVLSVEVSELLQEEFNTLSVTLVFTYEERFFQLRLSAQAKDAKHLEKELEKRLTSMLRYDALALMEIDDSLMVEYTYDTGYASLLPLKRGAYYKGLDAEGSPWGTAIVQQLYSDDTSLSLLVATGGGTLLPGMRLEEQKGREVALLFSSSLLSGGSFGLEGSYTQDIGLYPFRLLLGAGFTLERGPLSLSSIYSRAGFSVTFPLSMAFGLRSSFWRSSALAMECSLDVGYALKDQSLLYGSSALFSYRYRLHDATLLLALGNKHWVTTKESFSSGLFMQLGLAYTW